MREYGYFQEIRRFQYMPFAMEKALEAVRTIGSAYIGRPFVIDDSNRFVIENMIRWIHGDNEGLKAIDPQTGQVVPGRINAGIFIGGPTGTGKSVLMEVMSIYCKIDNVQVDVEANVRRCLSWPCVRVDEVCESFTTSGVMEKYKRMNVVAFQDVGAEPTESVYMGNRVNVFRQILESRGDRRGIITLITSNHRIDGQAKILTDKYGDRVVSRLREMCNYYELKGEDRRKQK